MRDAADKLVAYQRSAGIVPIGLQPNLPSLKQVYREGDLEADMKRDPVDFYSADTFNYVILEISADGKLLTVDTSGIDSYPQIASLSLARSLSHLGRIATRRGARTSLFIPTIDRLAVAVRANGNSAAEMWIYRPLP